MVIMVSLYQPQPSDGACTAPQATHSLCTKSVMGSGEQTADGWRATKFICRFATTLWVLALPAQHLLVVFIIRTIFVAIITVLAGDLCQSFPHLGCLIRGILFLSHSRQLRNDVEGGDLRAESS
ncbi:hypothetical protein BDZ89DRAFT_495701 [Hymenopellis radicata]|nr:hypothetical protein BDZ89DRAFT_495701 [Hymenopellis radicata]